MDRIPGLNEKEFLLERAIATLPASGISEAEARRMVPGRLQAGPAALVMRSKRFCDPIRIQQLKKRSFEHIFSR